MPDTAPCRGWCVSGHLVLSSYVLPTDRVGEKAGDRAGEESGGGGGETGGGRAILIMRKRHLQTRTESAISVIESPSNLFHVPGRSPHFRGRNARPFTSVSSWQRARREPPATSSPLPRLAPSHPRGRGHPKAPGFFRRTPPPYGR